MKTKNANVASAITDVQSLLKKLGKIKMWQKGGKIAPHKPLLILYALGQFSQGKEAVPFVEVDAPLQKLLKEFGPRSKHESTQLPFHHLQTDRLWTVTADTPLERRGNAAPGKTELRKKNAVGAFSKDVKRILRESRNLKAVATTLLENNFPDTYHQDLLAAVGLSLDTGPEQKGRSRVFRPEVLRAYESRCCVCGYDARLGGVLAGVEAAHIKWHHAGGPDQVSNGLALCTLHHKIFDLGAFTVRFDDFKLLFSEEISGSTQMDWLLGFHGKPMLRPQREAYLPGKEYLDWHLNTIFKGPHRDLPGRIESSIFQ